MIEITPMVGKNKRFRSQKRSEGEEDKPWRGLDRYIDDKPTFAAIMFAKKMIDEKKPWVEAVRIASNYYRADRHTVRDNVLKILYRDV